MKNQKKTVMLAVLLFMGLVIGSGAAMAAYTANPRNPTTYWMGANGVWQTDATFEARAAGQPTRYLKQTIPASKLTLGKLAKAAMGGPLNIAITAAIVGYAVWDSSSGEFYEPADPSTGTGYQDGYLWSMAPQSCTCSQQTGTVYFSSPGASAKWCASEYACSGYTSTSQSIWQNSATQWGVQLKFATRPSWDYTIGRTTDSGQTVSDPPAAQKTDEQVADIILQDSNLTKQILTDAIDRGTWRGGNWPEMEQAAADIAASLDRIDSGTATQADIDAEKAMYAEPVPATAAEPQAIPDDYAREPTLQAVRDEATAIKNNTQALVDTLGNDGSNLPPWVPPTLPADPVPDWDYTGQFTAFWDWAKGLFPFSFLLSPLTAFGGTAPPPIPDFSITVLGNSQTLSLQPVSVVFTWIRTANGILLLFGFYLIGLSIARRFI